MRCWKAHFKRRSWPFIVAFVLWEVFHHAVLPAVAALWITGCAVRCTPTMSPQLKQFLGCSLTLSQRQGLRKYHERMRYERDRSTLYRD